MSIELALLIWLAALYYAIGCFDNLAAKGFAALFRTSPRRSATCSRLNNGNAARLCPSRPRGNFFGRFVATFTSRQRPVRTTSSTRADGQTFYMDTVEMEWNK